MDSTLLLPWFPVILGVGVGGRLLDRWRGLALGIVGALLWTAVVSAEASTAGVQLWGDAWRVISLLAGGAAIIAMGAWSGELAGEGNPLNSRDEASREKNASAPSGDRARSERSRQSAQSLAALVGQLDQFDDWFCEHRSASDPWPGFDELIRSALFQVCGATHVRPYRLVEEAGELVPLRLTDQLDSAEPYDTDGDGRRSARDGVVGRVLTSGQSYVEGDALEVSAGVAGAPGELDAPTWCFAVANGSRKLGVVVVGKLIAQPKCNPIGLAAAERMIRLWWMMLDEAHRNRSLRLKDPVTGVLTREAFLHAAQETLTESYGQSEPVAVAVIALEGIRQLNDCGRWQVADQLLSEAARLLRRKIRLDDRVGRFDGSRFVLLLRRVDSELASLIISQLMTQLTALCVNTRRWGESITVRCGVVGSAGAGASDANQQEPAEPQLGDLISRAVAQGKCAREERSPIASDLHDVVSGGDGGVAMGSQRSAVQAHAKGAQT